MGALASFTEQLVETVEPKTSWLKAYLILALVLMVFYGVKILIRFYGDTYPTDIDLREVTDNTEPTW